MTASDLFKELETKYKELLSRTETHGLDTAIDEITMTQTFTMKESGFKIDVRIYQVEEED